jgi:splicing suppressor protein 51
MENTISSCTVCKKAASDDVELNVCAKCKTTYYCSRDCQKADWKSHKRTCGKDSFETTGLINSENYSSPFIDILEAHNAKPFTTLDNHTYLHNRPDKDVYKLLIDCFRMKQADDNRFENKTDSNSVYTGAANSLPGFRKFMEKASTARNLLPPGWNADKQKECEAFGMGETFSSLKKKTTKEEIIDHYRVQQMPMQLRMLGETIYGCGPGGQDGTPMRKMMMSMENNAGPTPGFTASMINVSF